MALDGLLIGMLESGRRDFLAALDGADGSRRQGGWSVLEIVEHVAIVEERNIERIRIGTETAPRRDPSRELRLFTMVRSRLRRVEAPEVVWPAGRFRTIAEARAEFDAVRDRSVAIARELGDGLYSRGSTHPFFGPVNGVELMQIIDAHARRHADQIREISGDDGV
jgi:hypothetical protein